MNRALPLMTKTCGYHLVRYLLYVNGFSNFPIICHLYRFVACFPVSSLTSLGCFCILIARSRHTVFRFSWFVQRNCGLYVALPRFQPTYRRDSWLDMGCLQSFSCFFLSHAAERAFWLKFQVWDMSLQFLLVLDNRWRCECFHWPRLQYIQWVPILTILESTKRKPMSANHWI